MTRRSFLASLSIVAASGRTPAAVELVVARLVRYPPIMACADGGVHAGPRSRPPVGRPYIRVDSLPDAADDRGRLFTECQAPTDVEAILLEMAVDDAVRRPIPRRGLSPLSLVLEGSQAWLPRDGFMTIRRVWWTYTTT